MLLCSARENTTFADGRDTSTGKLAPLQTTCDYIFAYVAELSTDTAQLLVTSGRQYRPLPETIPSRIARALVALLTISHQMLAKHVPWR